MIYTYVYKKRGYRFILKISLLCNYFLRASLPLCSANQWRRGELRRLKELEEEIAKVHSPDSESEDNSWVRFYSAGWLLLSARDLIWDTPCNKCNKMQHVRASNFWKGKIFYINIIYCKTNYILIYILSKILSKFSFISGEMYNFNKIQH